jgi:hypothetical protein
MQIALIDLERHWVTNVTEENFMMRYDIVFLESGNWDLMYNFLNDSVICEHFDYDLKSPYDTVRFIIKLGIKANPCMRVSSIWILNFGIMQSCVLWREKQHGNWSLVNSS